MIDDPDYALGTTALFGSYHFTPEVIIEFARKFDPQPFHVDPEAARNSVFGGLCASGWHTAAVWMRLNIAHKNRRHIEREAAGLPNYEMGPSPGIRNLRWLRPVFAGETITFSRTVTGLRSYRRRPGWSILENRADAWNEKEELVMTFDSAVLFAISGDAYGP